MNLLIVGRDYGAAEALAGRPFVGPSGKLLDRALAKVPLDRAACEVTNVVNVQPTGNRWEAHDSGNVEAGIFALRRQLTPDRVVLAVGEHAFHACLGLAPDAHEYAITEVRGYPFRGVGGCLVVPTVHPAFILRGAQRPYAFCFERDVAKAARYAREGYTEPQGRERLRSESGVLAYINDGLLAVDIETREDLSIACVAIAPRLEPPLGVCFDQPDAEEQRRELAFILASDAPKIFHNGQFDVTILERAGLPVNAWEHDTMLLWHTLEPVLAGSTEGAGGNMRTEKSLRFLASIFTDEPWWKNYQFQSHKERCVLCAKDARITMDIFLQMRSKL